MPTADMARRQALLNELRRRLAVDKLSPAEEAQAVQLLAREPQTPLGALLSGSGAVVRTVA
jgi:hypothetical protein